MTLPAAVRRALTAIQGRRAPRLRAKPNPLSSTTGTGTTRLSWRTAAGVSSVEVRVGAPDGPLFASSGPGAGSAVTGDWVKDGTVFFLQDRTGDAPLAREHTLATLRVDVRLLRGARTAPAPGSGPSGGPA